MKAEMPIAIEKTNLKPLNAVNLLIKQELERDEWQNVGYQIWNFIQHYQQGNILFLPANTIVQGDFILDWDEHWIETHNISGIVVEGNLIINGNLINASSDPSPFLLVLGNLEAYNVYKGGASLFVKNTLTVSGIVYAYYNDGVGRVLNKVQAKLLLINDHDFWVANGVEGIMWNTDIDGEEGLADILVPEAFPEPDDFDLEDEIILELLQKGKPLLKEGISVGLIEDIEIAIERNDITSVIHILDSGYKLNQPEEDSPIFKALLYNRIEIVKLFLEKGLSVHTRDADEYTPLLYAAKMYYCHQDIFTLLVQYGADIEETDNEGNTALLLAAATLHQGQSLKSVQSLLALGAEWGKKNKAGLGMYEIAARSQNIILLPLILEKEIERVNQIDEKDEGGYTLLIKAASWGLLETVQMLLQRGASLAVTDKDGTTPLMWAVGSGNLEVVELLQKNNADIHVNNRLGETALLIAVARGHLHIVRHLIEQGMQIPLHMILTTVELRRMTYRDEYKQKYLEIIRYLAGFQTGIDHPDETGVTPLVKAVLSNDLEVVTILVEQGADIHIKMKNGKSALDLAKMHPLKESYKKQELAINKKIIEKLK